MNTTYFKNIIMGNVFRTATGTALPTTYYIGLSSTAPTAEGTNVTEPSGSGTGYRRVQLTSLTTPEDGVINNSAAFTESAWFMNSSVEGVTLNNPFDAFKNGTADAKEYFNGLYTYQKLMWSSLK